MVFSFFWGVSVESCTQKIRGSKGRKALLLLKATEEVLLPRNEYALSSVCAPGRVALACLIIATHQLRPRTLKRLIKRLAWYGTREEEKEKFLWTPGGWG